MFDTLEARIFLSATVESLEPAPSRPDTIAANPGLVLSTGTLTEGIESLRVAAVGNLIFLLNPSGFADSVEVYNTVTGVSTIDALSQARGEITVATVGDLVLFVGGYTSSGPSDVVDIYNAATNSWSTAALSQARAVGGGVSIGGLAIFAGGITSNDGTNVLSNVVDIYDSANEQWSTATLSYPKLRTSSCK